VELSSLYVNIYGLKAPP